MAKPKQTKPDKKHTDKAPIVEEKKAYEREELGESLIRILGYDVPGSRNIYTGLTRIKGVSWVISNAICVHLNIPRTKKIAELSKEEIAKIEEALKNLQLPDFLKNRQSDPETGTTNHYFGSDLDMKKDFDIRRLKKIKSYKGVRHTANLPVRGQRTRSNFRSKGKAVGVRRKKK